MQLMGQKVVLYRTESGQACIVPERCPHLGASLAHGGSVAGEAIVCPFHGWQFAPDGRNCHVPYLERSYPNVALKPWHVEEKDGFIIFWHDALGRDPWWRWEGCADFGDRENYYEPDRYCAGVRKILPHQPMENGPDMLHFPHVHGAGEPATIVSYEEEDHMMRISYDLKFGAERESTRLTPNGPVVARLDSWATMSLGMVRFTFDDVVLVQAVNTTPVDMDHSIMFSTTVGRKQPDSPDVPAGRTKIMMMAQHAQISHDFNIWENQYWIEHPPYAGEEEKYFVQFRRWIRQFFPELAGT
jgi:phenylpropionate dioxygenase-like ring-hydroxylating dioxygenase large terminal subunit